MNRDDASAKRTVDDSEEGSARRADDAMAGVLRRERRRVRETPIVWALVASLCAAAATLGGALGWWRGSGYAAALLAAAALAALAIWWRRVPRTSERHLARGLDSEWALQSRLEAAVELAGESSAIALAQRADAARHVSGRGNQRTRLWLAGVVTAALALSLLGAEAMTFGFRAWRQAAAARAKAEAENRASLVWRSPESEIQATAIEEVPFTAYAESTTGFRTLTLEVSVNGDPRPSRPLAGAAVEPARGPGGHDLADSLYMDELGVKPDDIVSYRLRGEYGPADSVRTATSPEQFVKIRPSSRAAARPRPDTNERTAGESGLDGGETPGVDPSPEPARKDALTPRDKTPAGRLEQLARRLQQANARAQPKPAHEGQGSSGEGEGLDGRELSGIAREAEALAREDAIDGEGRGPLDEAARSIESAARHLERHDPRAAVEPAAAAEAALETAVQTQERVGRSTAVAELDQAQRALNAASRADASARAQELARIRRALLSAAEGQQQAGSTEAARRLSELARTPGPATPERMREMASAAARAQVALSPRADSFNRPLRQLSRAAQMPEGSDLGPVLGELEVASQHAEWLTPDPGVIESARRLASLADRVQRAGADREDRRHLSTEAVRLSGGLEAARSLGRRDEVVRHFDPEHVDPAYRTAIEAYFERLSREGAARGHAHTD